jgi:hypothetical protein
MAVHGPPIRQGVPPDQNAMVAIAGMVPQGAVSPAPEAIAGRGSPAGIKHRRTGLEGGKAMSENIDGPTPHRYAGPQ